MITGLNGLPIQTPNELIDQIKAQNPQATVHLNIVRDQQSHGSERTADHTDDHQYHHRAWVLRLDQPGVDVQLPFPVQIVPEKIVGGPSAGLMFTLAVYNAVTPTDITGGRKIAGTGTISLDGTVGPIGGVQQKVAAAEAAGAEYFLSPVENYDDARAVAQQIKVVRSPRWMKPWLFLHGLQPVIVAMLQRMCHERGTNCDLEAWATTFPVTNSPIVLDIVRDAVSTSTGCWRSAGLSSPVRSIQPMTSPVSGEMRAIRSVCHTFARILRRAHIRLVEVKHRLALVSDRDPFRFPGRSYDPNAIASVGMSHQLMIVTSSYG